MKELFTRKRPEYIKEVTQWPVQNESLNLKIHDFITIQ